MLLYRGPKLDLFDLNHFLFLTSLILFLLGFIFETAVIENFANWRFCIR